MPPGRRQRARAQGILVLLGLAPLGALGWNAASGGLGPNPVETITHTTGQWGLRLLLLTLAVTPARRLLDRPSLIAYRRTLGLLAFGYVCLHFATYLLLDIALDGAALLEDLLERTYISAGFTAFALLLPLALTSTRRAIRRLGRRWQTLHRLIYLAAVAAVVHFLWLVKADLREPLLYALALATLLGLRLLWHLKRRAQLVAERAKAP